MNELTHTAIEGFKDPFRLVAAIFRAVGLTLIDFVNRKPTK